MTSSALRVLLTLSALWGAELAVSSRWRYPAAMKIPVAANGDLVIPRQLVAELVAEPGEDASWNWMRRAPRSP